jgi:hypothetical protein
MFWEWGGGGVNVQRLKVRSINIYPPNPRRENSTNNLNKEMWGGGEGAHTEQYVRIKSKYLHKTNRIK